MKQPLDQATAVQGDTDNSRTAQKLLFERRYLTQSHLITNQVPPSKYPGAKRIALDETSGHQSRPQKKIGSPTG